MPRLFLFALVLALLSGCAAPATTPTFTPTPFSTNTPQPSKTPIPTLTETPTATPNAEATKQTEFEAKKAEALKMVSIKLDSPEDFATLPVLDDVADFDSGKVQEAEHWLIENVLPPANINLPESWSIGGNHQTGFLIMDWDHISEPNVKVYRFVDAFFVMRDGVKMLRIGLEFGGPGQLIHLNFEDPRWQTDPKRMNGLIATLNRTGRELFLVDNYGTETISLSEIYTRKVTLERYAGGDQLVQYWIKNHKLRDGADKTVFGIITFPIVTLLQ